MTGQPSVVEVLREHLMTTRVDERGHVVACCLCGVDLPKGDWSPPVSGSHPQHQADMLATAGLLASGPTPADAWDEGFADGKWYAFEGDDGPRFVNPYRTTETKEDDRG